MENDLFWQHVEIPTSIVISYGNIHRTLIDITCIIVENTMLVYVTSNCHMYVTLEGKRLILSPNEHWWKQMCFINFLNAR